LIQIPVYILVIIVIIALVQQNSTLLIVSGILLAGFLIIMIKTIWPGAITKFIKGGTYKYFILALAVIGGLYFLFSRFPKLLWIFPILIVIGIITELIEKNKK
jgi:hypothetical protein